MIQTFFTYQNSAPNKSLLGFAGFHNHGNDQTIFLTLLDPGFLETEYAWAFFFGRGPYLWIQLCQKYKIGYSNTALHESLKNYTSRFSCLHNFNDVWIIRFFKNLWNKNILKFSRFRDRSVYRFRGNKTFTSRNQKSLLGLIWLNMEKRLRKS